MDNSEVDSISQCDASVGTSCELSSGDFLIVGQERKLCGTLLAI